MTETKLSVKGQIVIPFKVRGMLGIRPGQRFEVEAMSDGTILLIPIPEDVVDAMELPRAERLEKALSDERRKEDERHEAMAKEIKD